MAPQWVWKVLQIAAFCSLSVWMFEGSNREVTLPAAMFLSFGLTGIIFLPVVYFERWQEKRRALKLGLPVPVYFVPESPLEGYVREAKEAKEARRRARQRVTPGD